MPTIRHIDSLVTTRYKIVKDFYASGDGFGLMEQKIYNKNKILKISFTYGKMSNIDSDSLNYKLTNNGVSWIKLTSTYDNSFHYYSAKKRDGKTIKFKELETSKCYIELPIIKAKQFIKGIW